MELKIGCDPEVFLHNGFEFVSAYGLFPGTKDAPFEVEKGAVQVDGMALEFNIDPAESEDQFFLNIQDVMNTLKAMVPEHEFFINPVAEFGAEYIKAQPAEAKELGCDPDYNAWTGTVNPKPDVDAPFRTASGHVHIGWGEGYLNDPNHVEDCNRVGRQMDFYLGLPSLLLDSDTKRRSLYGKGGCVRYKPYGCEYRTLSNFWLKDQKLIRWVYRQVQIGMHKMFESGDLADKYGDIREIIDTSNIKEAEKIIKQEGIALC